MPRGAFGCIAGVYTWKGYEWRASTGGIAACKA